MSLRYDARGERRLWNAVLFQALADAIPILGARRGVHGGGAVGTTIDPVVVDSARAFLRMRNPEFRRVCELAGVDPAWLLYKYAKLAVPYDQLPIKGHRNGT